MATKKKKKNPSYGFQKRIIIILIAFCVLAGAFFISPDNRNNLFSSFLTPPTSVLPSITEPSTTNPESTSDIPSTTESETTEIPSTSDVPTPTTYNPDGTEHKPWEPTPETDIIGYNVYCGTNPAKLDKKWNVGLVTTTILKDLDCGTTYYCSVEAYNADGMTSTMSAQISFTTPACGSGDDEEPPVIIIGGDTPPDPNKKPYPFIEKPDGEPEVTSTGKKIIATTSECPPPMILSLQYSTNLVNWKDSGVPPYDLPTTPPMVPPLQGYDDGTTMEKILKLMAPIVPPQLFMRVVCTDPTSPAPSAQSSSLGSSVLGSSQVSDTSMKKGEVLTSKPSLWSRILLFFSSLFSSSESLESDVLLDTPSMLPTPSVYIFAMRRVIVSSEGVSPGDSLSLSSSMLHGIISLPMQPLTLKMIEGTTVTIETSAGSDSAFVRWEGCTSVVGTRCTVVTDESNMAKAIFAPVQKYTLTATKSGTGSGTIAGLSNTSQIFKSGTTVTLSATPAYGSRFTGWSGACSGNGACVVSMTGNKSVVATFTKIVYTVTTVKSGTGTGTISGVSSNPQTFPLGANVVLTATPAAGSTFAGWSGGCSGTKQCILYMNENKAITATFVPTTYILTTTKDGTGSGNITGIVGTSQAFTPGRTVTLAATAKSGSSFVRWTGCTTTSGKTCTVTMSSAKTVKVTFNLVTHYTLSIAKSGTGSGLIRWTTSEGATGSTRYSTQLSLPRGVTVEFSAQPDPGTDTPILSNACTNTGACIIKMGADKTLQVTFTKE